MSAAALSNVKKNDCRGNVGHPIGKSAEFIFNGNAAGHSAAASVGDMTLVFKDAAFSGGNAASVRNNTQVFKIKFNDLWTHTCDDNVSGVAITPNSTWKS